MRILHTSDWHLGQSFFTKTRKTEHQAFLDWLLEVIEQQSIDAVIVAGDIFDTGTPPSYAREMYNQFVVSINQKGCTLLVLGGNHDSVSTLNESKQLLSCLNTYVVADTTGEPGEHVLLLNDRSGEPGALICAVPFIRARDVLQSQAGASADEKQKQLGEAIRSHYQQLFELAQKQRKELGLNIPIIATGHLTALGVTKTESERDIYIGTLEGFAADGFPPADYIALGHIHRPQIVAKSEHIRYSGSPIPLSFDELKSQKQVVIATFNNGKSESVEPVDVPMFRKMAAISGDLTEIEEQLNTYKNAQETVWLSVEVRVQDYLSDLQQRVQEMTEGMNVEVIQLRRAKGERNQRLVQQQNETLSELTPLDVFSRRIEQEQFDSDDEAARLKRITHTFTDILHQVETQGEQE